MEALLSYKWPYNGQVLQMALQWPVCLAGTQEGCVSKVSLRPRVEQAPKGLKAYSQHRILPLFQAKYSQLLSASLKDFFFSPEWLYYPFSILFPFHLTQSRSEFLTYGPIFIRDGYQMMSEFR